MCEWGVDWMDINKMKGDYDHYEVAQADTLLNWLLNHAANLSGSKAKATLAGRGVIVNGKYITQFDYPLEAGMEIVVSKSKENINFKNHYLKIVYEDHYLVVIEKYIGILSVAAGHSLLNVRGVLDNYFRNSRQKCMAHVVHRLDRETSSLMIYARDMATEQELEHNWHDIVYDHRYVAVVSGGMEGDEGVITSWLKNNRAYVIYSSPVDNDGKSTTTHFYTLDRTTEYSLVEYRLETGRKNQIHVHFVDIGHPVCEDFKHGNGGNPLDWLCLHAHVLCLTHLVTRRSMKFETQVPPTFKKLFKQADRYLMLENFIANVSMDMFLA